MPTRTILAEGPSGLNLYVEASILCVQRADSRKLQEIVLHMADMIPNIKPLAT